MKVSAQQRVLIDQICMCLPFASTVNAAMDMRQKDLYKKCMRAGPQDVKYQDAYHQRILKTKKWVMCTLLIPVIGQVVIGVYNLAVSCKKWAKKSNTPPPIVAPAQNKKSDTSVLYL